MPGIGLLEMREWEAGRTEDRRRGEGHQGVRGSQGEGRGCQGDGRRGDWHITDAAYNAIPHYEFLGVHVRGKDITCLDASRGGIGVRDVSSPLTLILIY